MKIECPEEYYECLTEEEYDEILRLFEENEISVPDSIQTESISDAQAVADFTWQVLFLSPWELAYIALPMSVLAFYGLSIYAIFKWVQRKFS
jgi:hypothetical protein